jgi:RsmE family RNA methyltransferase
MNFLILETDDMQGDGDRACVTDHRKINHLTTVLGVGPGSTLKVGLLGGNLGSAKVVGISDDKVELESVVLDKPAPPKLPITLVIAMPRPKALRRILVHATAMGIEAIHVIHSFRVEKSYWQSPVLEKIKDYALEGLEQSGDTQMPQITINKRFKPFVEDQLPQIIEGKRVFLAQPGSEDSLPHDLTLEDEVVFIIGAEGGFICYEVELLEKQGCHNVSLGHRIVHSETAVSMMVGQIMAHQIRGVVS